MCQSEIISFFHFKTYDINVNTVALYLRMFSTLLTKKIRLKVKIEQHID